MNAAADNERFHASGGVCPQTVFVGIWKFIARPNLCGTPACVKPPPRWAKAADTVQVLSGDFDSVHFDTSVKYSRYFDLALF